MWIRAFCKLGVISGALTAVALCFSLSARAYTDDALRERPGSDCRGRYSNLKDKPQVLLAQGRGGRNRTGAGQSKEETTPSSADEIKLLEFKPPLVHAPGGPAKAKGVIYFINGFTLHQQLAGGNAVPYFVKTLSEKGWDVIGAKMYRTEVFPRLLVPGASRFVERRIRELKGEGYQQVILCGQCWGAWVSLKVAQSPSSAAGALLLMAPSAYGQRGSPRFREALTGFGPILQGVKTPTMLILPDDTDWDPDPIGRADIAEKYFTEAKVPYVIIAKPPGFKGHMAAWLPVFDFAYGGCIQAFLETPRSAVFSTPPLADDDFRSIVGLDQIKDAESKRLVSAEPLAGKTFIAYTQLELVSKYYHYVSPTQRVTSKDRVQVPEDVAFRGGLHCAGETCSELIRWSDGYFLEFDPKTKDVIAWWIEDR